MPRTAPCAVVLAALALAGCSVKASDNGSGGGGAPGTAVEAGAKSADRATRNTTRIGGGDPIINAAEVANAVYPATDPQTRPPAVVLADKGNWQGIIAAAALTAAPVRAPILLSDGDSIPSATSQTIDRLKPRGITVPSKASAIVIGDKTPPPANLKSTVIKGSDPYAIAGAVDHFSALARGKPSPDVVVTTGEQPEFAMPASAWAARSGDAVLFVKRDSIPGSTRSALQQHQKPRIFVLGPPSAVSDTVIKQLGSLGKVQRIGAPTPVDNALAFARYRSGGFGWGAVVPGQNLTVANQAQPADAAGAAGLGANGIFAALLLIDKPDPLPRPVESYLLDIQPGYQGGDPSQGVYNHVWILGGANSVSGAVQDRIDAATALVPVDPLPK